MANTTKLLDDRRVAYAFRWSTGDAAAFEAAGDYSWMADQLPVDEYPSILEIGTGDGRGTRELLGRNHAVVSIDENVACVMLAGDRLRAAGFPIQQIEREVDRRQIGEHYEVRYLAVGDARMPDRRSAVVAEGDILVDAGLVDTLRGISPFDAVACWMIGTHEAVHLNFHLRSMKTDQFHYRQNVQMRVCEIADDVLRPGGVLQIVDRAIFNTSYSRGDVEHDILIIAKGTSLTVDSIALRNYAPSGSGIEMRLGPGRGKPVREPTATLVSTILRKPRP